MLFICYALSQIPVDGRQRKSNTIKNEVYYVWLLFLSRWISFCRRSAFTIFFQASTFWAEKTDLDRFIFRCGNFLTVFGVKER